VRPSSRELLEGIAVALERQVAPAVQDKWAASVLRSAIQLLGHLGVRVEDEPRLLREDNADARRVLENLAPSIAGGGADAAPLRDAVVDALARDQPDACDTRALAAGNEAYQSVIELLVRHRALVEKLTGDRAVEDELHGYLQRRLAREQHLYFPTFLGPPF
jgi:hypothetical protein